MASKRTPLPADALSRVRDGVESFMALPDPSNQEAISAGAAWRRQVEMVDVRITANNIYLPLDKAGNVPINWAEATTTLRVNQGARLLMPLELFRGLSGRVERADG